ncbi:capsular polysaccharide synthesis protein [Acinetobacter baumannii]
MGIFKKERKLFNVLVRNLSKNIDIDWISYKKRPNEKVEGIIPKVIWIYWDSPEHSLLVELCVKQVERMCPDYKINVLDGDSVYEYIDLPKFNNDLPVANISDYIRLSLLSKYGGVWMDASIFLTESIEWIISKVQGYDAFLFYSDACAVDINNPISENWFIIAPVNSPFIKAWFLEFSKCVMSSDPKNYYKFLWDNKELLQKIENPQYLICYISAILALRESDYNILYARSGSAGHYYNYKFNSSDVLVAAALLFKNKERIFIPKLIKFTKDTRLATENYLKQRKFKRTSLLGEAIIFHNL